MSKIGKQPIEIKNGVTTTIDGSLVKVSGPKGQLEFRIPKGLEVVVKDGMVYVSPKKKGDKEISALFGLTRASIANMIKGVDKEFVRKLILTGVGYKASMQGNDLVLSLGFAHPVKVKPIPGVKISVVENAVVVAGIDKGLVGLMAANIRAIKPPEPYKGKGIKFDGEFIRRKAGKAAKAAGAK